MNHLFIITETDLNECEQQLHTCDGNATCKNTVGSYFCTCNVGFAGNGVNCSPFGKSALNDIIN